MQEAYGETEPMTPVDLSALTDDELAARITTLWDQQLEAQRLERDLEAAIVATELEQEKRTR